MQLPLSLPPVLPSHRLGSKVTPCHKVPSCAFSGATLTPPAAPGGLMCLWPYLRPHWCHAEGAGGSWHWLGLGTGYCLFYITSRSPSASLSLSGGNAFKSVFAGFCVWPCRRTRTQGKHTLVVFLLPPRIRNPYLREQWLGAAFVSLHMCLFADICRECHPQKDHSIRKENRYTEKQMG